MRTLAAICLCLIFILPACNASSPGGRKGTLYLEDNIVGGLRINWLYLGDDGNFIMEPHYGVDPVNMALEKQKFPGSAGTYTKTANAISVTYANGKKEVWKIEYLNGKINTIDGWFVSEQTGLPANYKLNGNFSAGMFTSTISRVQTYHFKDDGTVTIDGLARANIGSASAVASGSQKATYNITGNTLTIRLENGETTNAMIGMLPGAKPSVIIQDQVFK